MGTKLQHGFTIVELLIVIVIIAILSGLVISTFVGIQDRARTSKIQDDLTTLSKAIEAARVATGKTLAQISWRDATAYGCASEASGTDLAALNKNTSNCWVFYRSTLNNISTAGGVNVRNLKDPWGRPYLIDENEGVSAATPCRPDEIAAYKHPFVSNDYGGMNKVTLLTSLPGC